MYTTWDEWTAAVDARATTPEGTLTLFLMAAAQLDSSPDLARQAMTLLVHKRETAEDPSSPSGMKPSVGLEIWLDQFTRKPEIPRSYLGGTPDNGYAMADPPAITLTPQTTRQDKEVRLFVQSGGKDNPTPTVLKRNKKGVWKLCGGTSSLATGVKKIEDDDF